MSAEKSSWMNRLILVLLTFNLVCLILLLVQQNRQNNIQPAVAPEPVRHAEETLPTEPADPSTYSPVTNRARPRLAASAPRSVLSTPGRFSTGPDMALAPDSAALPVLLPTRTDRPHPSAGWLAGSARAAQKGYAVFGGRVWLEGAPPPETLIPLSGACADAHSAPLSTRHYVVTPDGRLADVLVYIKSGLQNSKFPVPTNQAMLQLSGCLFEPYVMGLQTGQKFRVNNLDPIMHNFHATPRVNHELNSALMAGLSREFTFSRAEIVPPVRLKCDVHPWEFAYVAVLPHPFFAVTDTDGEFRLPPLPPGKYQIAAFHLKAGETTAEIELREGITYHPFHLFSDSAGFQQR